MKPIDYLTQEEIFILKSVREDLKHCETKRDLQLLERTLDELLERSVMRFRHEKGIK